MLSQTLVSKAVYLYQQRVYKGVLTNVIRVPYDGYWGAKIDTSLQLTKLLSNPSSGHDLPAAIIIETIQGEGGLNVSSAKWLQNIAKLARKHGVLLIIIACNREKTTKYRGKGYE